MKSAGVAQRPEREASRLEDAGANPAPRSSIAEAIAEGLRVVESDREAGYSEGLAGKPWMPLGRDQLSYAFGFAAGRRDRQALGGGAP